jgi:hypothetical protein
MFDATLYEGERRSFYQLFKKYNYKIEVPIIQRDYAQGRMSEEEVREKFLEALYNYLEDNIPNRDLDFIYGSTEKDGDIEKFIPLDGQQRLTTLFLLHWYLANISGNTENFSNTMCENDKSKFTYLTRSSSTEFCDALLTKGIDVFNLLIDSKTKKRSISITIKNSNWYFLSWNKDPTVKSMLIMLDDIFDLFQGKSDYYDRLIRLNNPVITFLYLDLGRYKLTEDLYIKMNSRGKPLSPFENFKAKLEQLIKKLFSKEDIKYELNFKENGTSKQVDIKEYFSFNIDTKWANLFWEYRYLVGDKNTFDDEIMNFMYTIISNQFAIGNNENKNFYPSILKKYQKDDKEVPLSFYRLKENGALNQQVVKYLINSFENLVNGNNKINNYLDNHFYFNENEIFENALKGKLTRVGRIQFHAYLKYLILHPKGEANIFQWMRFIHNVTTNTEIDDTEKEISAFKDVERLLPNANRILSYLIENENLETSFFNRQIQEERIKAVLIKKSEVWRNLIEKIEIKSYFKGQILFIIEFSGILNYFENNNNCNWSDNENSKFLKDFNFYSEKATSFFSLIQTEENNNYILERAVLTKGDYLIPSSNYRFSFLSSNKINNYLRDYSFKALMRLTLLSTDESDSLYWREKRFILKALFDDLNFENSNLIPSLNFIIDKSEVTDWRRYFISNPALIKYCDKGLIRFKNENDIMLLMNIIESSRMKEIYTYNLYTKEIINFDDFLPFDSIYHTDKNHYYDMSFLKFEGWVFKNKKFSIQVFYKEKSFIIIFNGTDGILEYDNYDKEIIGILLKFNFFWNESFLSFELGIKNEKDCINLISDVCANLKSLKNE